MWHIYPEGAVTLDIVLSTSMFPAVGNVAS